MELPVIVKRMGRIENGIKIYMEDYVLAYLQNFKTKRMDMDVRIILYGRKEQDISGEIYIIYGAAQDGKEYFKEYSEIGCLNIELWKKTEGMCDGILLGDAGGGRSVKGYYIFYDEAQAMKEYMSDCYEENLYKKYYQRKTEETVIGQEGQKEKKQAELVALSNEIVADITEATPLYSMIRAVVIIIFIVFCAIAVTTVNSYEKIENFVQAAEQLNESMEQP